MKRKVGRPVKENPELMVQNVFRLNEQTSTFLKELTNRSYMSKTGIARMAIDYLYYQVTEQDIPDELNVVLKDLKSGNKPINGID